MDAPSHPGFLASLKINTFALVPALLLYFRCASTASWIGFSENPPDIPPGFQTILTLAALASVLLSGMVAAYIQLAYLRPNLTRGRKAAYYALTALAFPLGTAWTILLAIFFGVPIVHIFLTASLLIPAAMLGMVQMDILNRLEHCLAWSLSLWIPVSVVAVIVMWQWR